MMTDKFKITPRELFGDNEQKKAKNHWSKVKSYTQKQEWSVFMGKRILECDPTSVFEFGCNAGMNLMEIREQREFVHVSGIDINRNAIDYGRETGLSIALGDETWLDIFPDNCFDVTFTVSVFDHLPHPESAMKNLARMARKAFLLFEPWLGEEGKVVKNLDRKNRRLIKTTPFSYSWDYLALATRHLPNWDIASEDYKIETNLGRYYQLYTLTPKPNS